MSSGEQKALGHHGVSRLEDLAKLKVVVDTSDLRPYDLKSYLQKTQKVHDLSTDPIVGAKLDWLVERAQYMLGGIRPSSPYASRNPLDAMANGYRIRQPP